MLRHGDATEAKRDLTASRATKGPRDARYLGTFPVLSKANYPLWAMRMQLHFEAHSLWEAIELEIVVRKKDRQALSSIKRSSRLVSREKKNKSSFHMVPRNQEEKVLKAKDAVKIEDTAEAEEEAMTKVLVRTRNLKTNLR
ncbi:unnamed protein product [Spirodela intermedia]|uniref:DUF4219 domain-containing protein n=1 Tax=Spirodela intermedia TaxID=51605 RepID=A0A7I8IHC2_SPIIN|nr:unnamed protein product [Spirodela intermedia]CAA6656252.1 unnamed protein product [Spirodela intermedia]